MPIQSRDQQIIRAILRKLLLVVIVPLGIGLGVLLSTDPILEGMDTLAPYMQAFRPSLFDVPTLACALLLLTILHEAGHFLATLSQGWPVHAIVIGFGPTLFSFRVFGYPVHVGGMLCGGCVLASPPPSAGRWPLACFVLSGVLTELAVLAMLVYIAPGVPPKGANVAPFVRNAWLIFVTIILLDLPTNLIPYKFRSQFGLIANDGLLLWRVLRHGSINHSPLLDAMHGTDYPQDAFEFVLRTLNKVASGQMGELNHVSGHELCWKLRDCACDEFGEHAYETLTGWNIQTTADFGRIVFAMVKAGCIQATEQDREADFAGLYELRSALRVSNISPFDQAQQSSEH